MCQEWALHYVELGWSVIPIPSGTKKATIAWSKYQTERASRGQVENWFYKDRHGPAVVFGEVSGGLACRDFDTMQSFEAWQRRFPDLAATLPIVKTSRGRHVYFRISPEHEAEIRKRLQKTTGTGAIDLGDGELRLGACYCLLPPAVHPDGIQYEWVNQPGRDIPILDVFESGLAEGFSAYTEHTVNLADRENAEDTNNTTHTSSGQTVNTVFSVYMPGHPEIDTAISTTLPTGPGQRHKQIFTLLRAIQAIPGFWKTDWKDVRPVVEPIVREWHSRCSEVVRGTVEESIMDAARGWSKVKTPGDQDTLAQCAAKAESADVPEFATIRGYSEPLKQLVKLCRELQRNAADGTFYLSCRCAGRALDICHTSTNALLQYLEMDGVLKLVAKGTTGSRGKANEYRYIAE